MSRSSLFRAGAFLALAAVSFAVSAQDATPTDEDFFGEGVSTISSTTVSTADPTEGLAKSAEGIHWGGSVSSGATWTGTWTEWPDVADLELNFTESLGYSLASTLNLDGRPSKDFRYHFSLKAGAPFTNDASVLTSTTTSTTVKVPNLKIWEMYTDVTVADRLLLRFGKQSASWGVAYFYSPGDVISLTAKDATDPTASREGPVALNAILPFPNQQANLSAYVLLRDDYFPTDQAPTLQDLGYALQADILLGEAQLSLGGFYQKDNAPKLVATINTGLSFLPIPELNKINLFSEGIALYGADVLKGSGTKTLTIPTVGSKDVFDTIDTWDAQTVYFTGTVGASYSNSDLNFSIRTEYYYNPFGSDDKTYAQRALNTWVLSRNPATKPLLTNNAERDWGYGDLSTPGIHNLTTLVSLSKLFGSKVNFSALIQQNLSDGSGWAKPGFSWSPWDELSFSAGWSQVWGDDGTQFPLQFKKFVVNFGVNFGTGRF